MANYTRKQFLNHNITHKFLLLITIGAGLRRYKAGYRQFKNYLEAKCFAHYSKFVYYLEKKYRMH